MFKKPFVVLLSLFVTIMSVISVANADENLSVYRILDGAGMTTVVQFYSNSEGYNLGIIHNGQMRPLPKTLDMAAVSNDGNTVIVGTKLFKDLWEIDLDQDPWIIKKIVDSSRFRSEYAGIHEVVSTVDNSGVYIVVNDFHDAFIYHYDFKTGKLSSVVEQPYSYIENLEVSNVGLIYDYSVSYQVFQTMIYNHDFHSMKIGARLDGVYTTLDAVTDLPVSHESLGVPGNSEIFFHDHSYLVYAIFSEGNRVIKATDGENTRELWTSPQAHLIFAMHWRNNPIWKFLIVDNGLVYATNGSGDKPVLRKLPELGLEMPPGLFVRS